MSFLKLTASATAIAALSTTAAFARDNVQVAGSSTVLPYASIVAELFGDNTDFPTPVVESGGSSAGLKRFCEGVGENTIDVANASRAIREKEIKACAENGVTDIIEVRIGYDGIVFASQQSGPEFTAFEPADIYNAIGATVLKDGELVDNPHQSWTEFNADLPDAEIAMFIPGTKHGTREVFEEKVLLQGCEDTGAVAAMEENGIGVFGLAFYENNTDKLKVATMSGVSPSTETIATGEYPVSRPLFFYVKKAHIGVIPGLKEYAQFFTADEIAGPGGPLSNYGLVADPELAKTQAKIAEEVTMGEGM